MKHERGGRAAGARARSYLTIVRQIETDSRGPVNNNHS